MSSRQWPADLNWTMNRMPLPPCAIDDVICEPEAYAPGPSARRAGESEALLRLTRTLSEEPALATQRLVEAAMALTGAASAGLSLEDEDDGQPVFRWIATTGEYARYRNGTMPRDFSPCGTVLERRKALVMRDPERCFPSIAQLHVPVRCVLLVPFSRAGLYVGTVWVVAHTSTKRFTTDDLRMVQNLATFASAVLDTKRHALPRRPVAALS
jgi:hypothetical protein